MKIKFLLPPIIALTLLLSIGFFIKSKSQESFATNIEQQTEIKNSVFTDVPPENPNFEAIYFLKNKGIINGYKVNGKLEYKPENPVNRAEFLKIIYEGNNLNIDKNSESCFPDVPESIWFTGYVCQAKEDGIINGYADGNFRPEQTINQAEALKILAETSEWEKSEISDGSPWYDTYLKPAREMNLLPEKEIDDLMTRGDIAEIIFRNTVIETLKIEAYDPKYNEQLFQFEQIPLTGPLSPEGVLGPLGPLKDSKFNSEFLNEDFFTNNFCYYSDQGEYSGDALEFLQQFTKEDFDKYISGSDIDDFGKMFCYETEQKNDLSYFSPELRNEYEVLCWQDSQIPKTLDDSSQEIFCYVDNDQTTQSFEEFLEISVDEPEEELKVSFDEDTVKILSFRVGNSGKEDSILNGITIHNIGPGHSDIFSHILVDDTDGETLFNQDTYFADWDNNGLTLNFKKPLKIAPGNAEYLEIYADLDWEYYTGEVLMGFPTARDFITEAVVNLGANLSGPLLSLAKPLKIEDNGFPLCMLGAEANKAGQEAADDAAIHPSVHEKAELDEDSHVVIPLNQGGRDTCFAAAIYSSMRWMENYLKRDDLVTNGQAGYEYLIPLFHPEGIWGLFHSWIDQYSDLAGRINRPPLNQCLEASIDTNLGPTIKCENLQAEFQRKCDIPLGITCKSKTTGKGWGHEVDLVDLEIDPAKPNMCKITFANSWLPDVPEEELASPAPDDFAEGGVYQVADYDPDSTSFTVLSQWGDAYNCTLHSAMYICPKQACIDAAGR